MPRFAQVVAGSREMVSHYTSITCYRADGTELMTAQNLHNPQAGTSNNHCSDPSRDYMTLRSDGALPDLKIVGRAYPASDPFGPGSSWSPWEAAAGACNGLGLDKWAIMIKASPSGDGRPKGNEPGGPQGSNTGCLASVSNDGDARNWEALGDDRTPHVPGAVRPLRPAGRTLRQLLQ